ncbi:MAG: glutamine-hydrolyzing GMP synthase [Gammaproteobacteria bacterium]|nr:glutamine-hydrolyzing GMP synthase [Gammaproteobacteria bacterium]
MPDRHDRILILDFGSQYTQLIGRRVRELNVYCEIHPWDTSLDDIKAFDPAGIILSGGPATVTAGQAPRTPAGLYDLGCPMLGICYGMQCLADDFGGEVQQSEKREFGHAVVRLLGECELFAHFEDTGLPLPVWMSHGYAVTTLPEGFRTVAVSDNSPHAAFCHDARKLYGLQFHPEVTHTEHGGRILWNFVVHICRCRPDWTPANIVDESVEKIRAKVGDDRVILGLSGGVDSSVVAAMLHEAIGDQLTCIFVDNGLLRLNEAEEVMATFAEHMGIRVILVDAGEEFRGRLEGVTDPEDKRRIIGNVFIEVFEREAEKIEDARWLAQGTIYPDVIESAASKTGKAKVIKSHHNVGGLPEHMRLELLEPLRELFKDEVRRVGLALGLPEHMVMRHPFPGPGLGVRILGEVRREYADTLRLADHIFITELRQSGWYEKVSQAFAVFLPVRSVGVVGDNRAYEHVVALRAVETTDFMTARWSPLPWDLLERVSSRIINEVPGISRVTYDISSKPPATIEWE